jgi:hypothetical protein
MMGGGAYADLIMYCKRKKCKECAFYDELGYRCALGPAIRDLSEEVTDGATTTLDEAIECVKKIYRECIERNMKSGDGNHCNDCQYEYKEYGLYCCRLGRSVTGFDNPTRWGFVNNIKIPKVEEQSLF